MYPDHNQFCIIRQRLAHSSWPNTVGLVFVGLCLMLYTETAFELNQENRKCVIWRSCARARARARVYVCVCVCVSTQ